MRNKTIGRIRRSGKTRAKIRRQEIHRLTVHRTLNNIYVQLISPCGKQVLASASTLEKDVASKLKHGGNIEAAGVIGGLIADRSIKAGIKKVAFDRAGYKYHGRVKALADAAREGGLEF